MQLDPEKKPLLFVLDDFVPELKELITTQGLEVDAIDLPIVLDEKQKVVVTKRNEIILTDGKKSLVWNVPSLRALFRGDKVPPSLTNFPPEYVPHFALIEDHALLVCDHLGDRTDREFEEIYSAIRRRPDGRSLGVAHDLLWQAVVFMVATRPVSPAEFEEILARLGASARTFGMGLVSRNYIENVRTMFG
jgi:hypothetical protein